MQLTRSTACAMRVLLYLGSRPDRLCPNFEIATAHGRSPIHLMNVVSDLVSAGYLESVGGRSGRIRLAMPTEDINGGVLIRYTEDEFDLVVCGKCIIARACGPMRSSLNMSETQRQTESHLWQRASFPIVPEVTSLYN